MPGSAPQPNPIQPDTTRPEAPRPPFDKGTEVIVPPSTNERRRECAATHTTTANGQWTRGDDEALGQVICADGTRQVKFRCRVCGTTGNPVPTSVLNQWGLTPDDIEWSRLNEPATYPPCTYSGCGTTPTEMHHFAPRNTFGPDADNWPCLPLCRAHHHQWHTRMDGYRWHQKGQAA